MIMVLIFASTSWTIGLIDQVNFAGIDVLKFQSFVDFADNFR
jgi:hypothetical protein